MPLSEREQRILEEIEKHLHQEDPGLAREVARRTPVLGDAAKAKLGIALFLGGLAVLLGFFFKGWLVLGVAAFGAMVAGIVLFTGSVRGLFAGGPDRRERLSRTFRRWEDRIRRRYKRI